MEVVRVVVLVHGTFAATTAWVQPGSAFRRALDVALPQTEVFMFGWTGQNTHAARLHAGEELANFLAESLSTRPHLKHYVLAHSHGGNVALYACRRPDVAARIGGIVTIATPFLWLMPRRLPGYVVALMWGCCTPVVLIGTFATGFAVAALVGLALILCQLIGVEVTAINELQPDVRFFDDVGRLVLLPLLMPGVALGYWFVSPQYRRFRRWVATVQNKIQSEIATPIRDVPLLNLQVTFDEARWWLTVLRAVGQGVVICHIPLVWIASCFLPVLFLAGISSDLETAALFTIGPLASMAMILVVLPTAFVLCVLRGYKFGLGESGWAAALFVDVGVRKRPQQRIIIQSTDTGQHVTCPSPFSARAIYQLEPLLPTQSHTAPGWQNATELVLAKPFRMWAASGLRHSLLYASPDVCITLAGWILLQEAQRRSDSMGAG